MPSPNSYSPVINSIFTGDVPVDALISGTQWSSASVSYSFLGTSFTYSSSYPDTSFFRSVQVLTPTQQAAVVSALGAWSNVAAINFTASPDNASTVGDIRIAFSASFAWGNSVGITYLPANAPSSGDVWLDPFATESAPGTGARAGTFGSSSFLPGSYGEYTVLHELGHAIGLKHPFEASTLNSTLAPTSWDSRVFTLMSYTPIAGRPDLLGFTFQPTTPMLLDIAAAQALYGANHAYNAGDTTYSFNDNAGQYYFQTLWDGGGYNTISYSGNTGSSIDLRQGYGSTIGNRVYAFSATNNKALTVSNLWIAWGTFIDKVVLTGSGNNTVQANDDGDTLVGGAGSDTMTGGAGDDTFYVGRGADVINGAGGTNSVVFGSGLLNYNIVHTASGYTVSSRLSGTAVDTLSNVQKLVFSDMSINLEVQSDARTVSSTQLHSLEELYVAFFDRVPDADGLQFWTGQLKGGQSINAIADSFYAAGLQYASVTGFTASMSSSDFINVVYRNVLGRPDGADAAGLAYWVAGMADGTQTRGSLVATILGAAHAYKGDPTWGWVADLLDNKIAVADTFAVSMGLGYNTPADSISHGVAIAAAVTPSSTAAAITLIGVPQAQVSLS